MKNKILLTLLLIKLTLTGFSTVWPVSNMGNTFSSATITINFGDTVNFLISGSHDAREVSLMTWNANGNTALFGGFQTNFGGGMVYPTQLGVGSHYYVCTPHASMGMKGIIIVQNCSAPISPNSIIGNANVCSATSNTYSVTPVLGATSYSWTLPGSWTGSSSTNSITTIAGISSGNISVSAINSCGSSAPQTLAVNVNTSPLSPTIIIGNINVCSATSNTYSVTPVLGATSYSWTIPGSWTGASSTNSITTTVGNSSGNISVSAINSCGSSASQTLAVNVNTFPLSPNIIIGNINVCYATSNTYSVTPVLGATSYTWSLPGSWTGASSTNSITTNVSNSSGNISVSAINSCGSSASQTLAVNVNSVNTSVSQSGNILSANISGATYQWINCINNTIILGQISQTFNAPAIGNYAVIITQNGCSDTSSCYNISTVEISENSFSIFTKIYPNPSTGKIQIIIDDLKFIKNSSIEIFNMQGVIIYQSEIINSKFDIDLINQTKGFYFVKISAGEKIFTRKILIE